MTVEGAEPAGISWQEALEAVTSAAAPLPAVEVGLEQAAGHVCAADVASPTDVPPFTNSSMDGFALRAQDTTSAQPDHPVSLEVIGTAAAGAPFSGGVAPGQTVEIMTGGTLPEGADAVQKIEVTQRCGTDAVLVLQPVAPGNFVRTAGGDTSRGDILIRKGEVLKKAAQIGLLASCGVARLPVIAKPRVALLTTGNEIIAPGWLP